MRALLTRDTIDALADVVAQAAQAVMEIYNHPAQWHVTRKADASPLTQADLRANEIIVSALAELTPDIPVLSEESPWLGGKAACYWALDPLDGTKEFIKRNGEFTINIALVFNGVARLGMIGAPALGTIWAGIRGDDRDRQTISSQPRATASWLARLQNRKNKDWVTGLGPWNELAPSSTTATPTHPRPEGSEHGLRIVGSRSHAVGTYPDWLRAQLSNARIKPCGSSLKFCLIAQGDADLYVRMGPTCIWDTAAGHAILSAAGGYVVHADTRRELTYPDPQAVLNPAFVAYLPQQR